MGELFNKELSVETPTDNQIIRFDSALDNWGTEPEVNIKSGKELAVPHNTLTTINFSTAFANIPHIVVSLAEDPGQILERIWVEQESTTLFKVQFKIKQGSAAKDVLWII